jgi:hypothetical protein
MQLLCWILLLRSVKRSAQDEARCFKIVWFRYEDLKLYSVQPCSVAAAQHRQWPQDEHGLNPIGHRLYHTFQHDR